MTTTTSPSIDLATAAPHDKLDAFFGISIGLQRRIGTFVVLFSMIEQQLEFVLLSQCEAAWGKGIPPTDGMTVGERLKAVRALCASEPALAVELNLAADIAEVLMAARHTVAHGAPIDRGRLERNRSWLGEARKRPFSAMQLEEPVLDAAACAGDVLLPMLGSIGAHLAGQFDLAIVMMPSDEQKQAASRATAAVRQAIEEASQGSGN